jgi:dihydropyrimidine dehydrogenase (NAD+) subunit PreA
MCREAPCTAACKFGCDPSGLLLDVRFGLQAGALKKMSGCKNCKACEKACIHYDYPLRIAGVAAALKSEPQKTAELSDAPVDLSVEFCGVKADNPFFLSSSIVAGGYEMCARALRQGWGGLVYKSVCVPVLKETSPRFGGYGKERTPFVGFRNMELASDHALAEDFAAMKRLKKEFPHKAVIASVMGMTDAQWVFLARECEKAGVDMIECNFSCPHSKDGTGSDVGQSPETVAYYTRLMKGATKLPILAKMTPNVSDMVPPAAAAIIAGADGIAAINTVKSFTGFDPDTLKTTLDVAGKSAISGYSGKAVKPIALRFMTDLHNDPRTKNAPLSGMGGIETWTDALDFLLVGCQTVQVTTAVMQYGYRIVDDLIDGLSAYMVRQGVMRVAELVGAGNGALTSPDALDRETVLYPAFVHEKCTGCGRCYLSCADAGHQAIAWDAPTRTPALINDKCAGCHLCLLVCPAGAIQKGRRLKKPAAIKH